MPKDIKATINWAQERATRLGGSIIVPDGLQVKTTTSIMWRCHRGHVWPNSVKNMRDRGTWCQICTSDSSSKIIEYILNKIFGEEYIFKSQKLECIGSVCSSVNKDLHICIDILGDEAKERRDTVTRAGYKYIHIKPFDISKYQEIASNIAEVLGKEDSDYDSLMPIPSIMEVVDHHFKMMEKEVEIAVREKGGELRRFEYLTRKDSTIEVLCPVCRSNSKKWNYDDIIRTDARKSSKLTCDDCCKTKPKGEECLKNKYLDDGFELIKSETRQIGNRSRKYILLKCLASDIILEMAKDNYGRRKGCACHVCRGTSKNCPCEMCKK